MKRETYRSLFFSGSLPVDPLLNQYQSCLWAGQLLTQLVEDMVFRDKVDLLYDPKVVSSRRRIEYPSLDDQVMKIFLAKFDNRNSGASETKVKEERRVCRNHRRGGNSVWETAEQLLGRAKFSDAGNHVVCYTMKSATSKSSKSQGHGRHYFRACRLYFWMRTTLASLTSTRSSFSYFCTPTANKQLWSL